MALTENHRVESFHILHQSELSRVHVLRLIGKGLKAGLRFEEMSRKDELCLGDYISFAVGQQEEAKPLNGLILGLIISFLVWAAIIYGIIVLF
jgi:hypothetical protein